MISIRSRRSQLDSLSAIYAGLFALFYLLHVYWKNPYLQYTASTVYIIASLWLVWRIYMTPNQRVSRAIVLLLLELGLLLSILRFPFLAIPWITLVPWLAANKGGVIWRAVGGLLHAAAALLLVLVLLVRLFVDEQVLASVKSPDGKHAAIVTMINPGAVGGSTTGDLVTVYGPFIHKKIIYSGHFRDVSKVEWKDNRYFTIDGFEVDSESGKPVIQKGR